MSDTNPAPSLGFVIDQAIRAQLTQLHTAIPAQIVTYDSATQKASIQVCIKRKYADGTLVNVPVIPNVPVVHPRASGTIIHLPLKKGDYVLAVFSERSLDVWLDKGGIVDPNDPRRHDFSDAYAIPGGYPFASPASVSNPEALEIQFPAKIILKSKDSGEELVDLLVQLLTALIAARTATLGGPMPLIGAEFPVIKAKLEAMKG